MKQVMTGIARIAMLAIVAAAVAGTYWYWFRDSAWSHLVERDPHGEIFIPDSLIGVPVFSGGFSLQFLERDTGLQLQITDAGGRQVWRSQPGRAFLSAALVDEEFREARGMAFYRQSTRLHCRNQTVNTMVVREQMVHLDGHMTCQGGRLPWTMTFGESGKDGLDIAVRTGEQHEVNRLYMTKGSHATEGHYGFGESFSWFDLKGRNLPILVSEQGVGRGTEPVTTAADLTNDGAGGSFASSYAPMALWHTSDGESFLLHGHAYSRVDMRRDDATILEVRGDSLDAVILSAPTPLDRLTAMTARTGRMPSLPDGMHRGAILGIQGGPDAVRLALRKLQAHNAPVSGVWLQDWVGQRPTSFGKQLWWNWVLDKERYPDWQGLRDDLAGQGIGIYSYLNPFLTDVSSRNTAGRNLFQEAKDQDLLVKNKGGSVYMIRNTSFAAGLLDLSNPAARDFAKDVIRDEILASGVQGWMADFGEGLPFDAVLHDGSDPVTFHNQYPEIWARLNREVIEEAGLTDTVSFFMRSATAGSQRHAGLFWAGDQLVDWGRHDGIKSAVTGILSGGLSGMTLNHSDIGGYTSISNPLKNYHRSKELLMRWAELAAFGTVFRSHEGNLPGKNHQFHSDQQTAKHFARMATVFACWKPYRDRLIVQAVQKGWPVMRHPWLHYPDHKAYQAMDYEQFMVGADMIIAPVLDQGDAVVTVELADDGWQHIWSGQDHGAGTHPILAPFGEPAVFVRRGSQVAMELRRCLGDQGLL